LLERIEGITDVQELRNYLNRHNQAIHKQAPLSLLKKVEKKSSSVDFSHLDRPAFEQIESTPISNSAIIATPSLPMTMEEVFRETPAETAAIVSENNLPLETAQLQLYGVEVAVLQQYSSVIQYVRSLEKKVADKVFILLRQEGKEKAYHVVIGQLDSRKAAFDLRSRLLNHKIKGVVKALEVL
jgi:hypothetical protein